MRRGLAAMSLTVLFVVGCGKTAAQTVVVAPPPASQQLFPEAVYRVPSGSMEPTLTIGSHVLIRPLTSAPTVGDVVIFHPPEGAAQEECGPTPHVIEVGRRACAVPVQQESTVRFIKRIAAGPGDEIYISEGHIFRKRVGQPGFTPEPDSYTRPCGGVPECSFPTPIKIPAGEWFMMGDNRGESDDSRFWGPVPTEWIIGVARPCSVVGLSCIETK
jgi:signal peptidase I